MTYAPAKSEAATIHPRCRRRYITRNVTDAGTDRQTDFGTKSIYSRLFSKEKVDVKIQVFYILVRSRLVLRSGPDCGQDQIGLFLKIDLATGNHVSQYHL